MTCYSIFNKWVYNYYIDNCIPNQPNSLSIPSSAIDEFAAENDIKLNSFNEVNNESWYYLNKSKDGIPQYFGLIALQCLAAFKMQNIDNINAGNFRYHFAELVGINDVHEIDVFCAEKFDLEFRIQEIIWISAKDFFSKKNINIDIPEVGENAGRYTRFPKSQIVLNYEDLKEYKTFFISINNEFESISFVDFTKYYKKNISKFRNNFQRNNNTKNEHQWSEIERRIYFSPL